MSSYSQIMSRGNASRLSLYKVDKKAASMPECVDQLLLLMQICDYLYWPVLWGEVFLKVNRLMMFSSNVQYMF